MQPDLLTSARKRSARSAVGQEVVFVGDGNNVAKSLAITAATSSGRPFVLASPPGYGFDAAFREAFRRHAPNGSLTETHDPAVAVRGADIVYTDVWTSMGQEAARRAVDGVARSR